MILSSSSSFSSTSTFTLTFTFYNIFIYLLWHGVLHPFDYWLRSSSVKHALEFLSKSIYWPVVHIDDSLLCIYFWLKVHLNASFNLLALWYALFYFFYLKDWPVSDNYDEDDEKEKKKDK